MSIIANRDKKVADLLTQIQKVYPKLLDDLKSANAQVDVSSALDTITRSEGRPALPIRNGEIQPEDGDSWSDRLQLATQSLGKGIAAVGRVQLANHPSFKWVGTGWLVADDIIVTARHVADVFARRTGDGYVFRTTPAGTMAASIDFLQEADNPASREVGITEVLYIEQIDGPDLAFLRVQAGAGGPLPKPIRLSEHAVKPDQFVAVIGYSARDARIPDVDLMEELFGKTWEKKHLSPGVVMAASETSIEHDCSTVGGSGGAPLIDLETGEAVGLNFAGLYQKANYAIPAAIIADRLKGISSRGSLGALPPPELTLGQTNQYLGDDQWNWAVWLDGSHEQLDAVESVEYTLHPTFPKPVRLVQERSSNFRLESSGWGSFLIRAKVTRKDGSSFPLRVELDLHYPSGAPSPE